MARKPGELREAVAAEVAKDPKAKPLEIARRLGHKAPDRVRAIMQDNHGYPRGEARGPRRRAVAEPTPAAEPSEAAELAPSLTQRVLTFPMPDGFVLVAGAHTTNGPLLLDESGAAYVAVLENRKL